MSFILLGVFSWTQRIIVILFSFNDFLLQLNKVELQLTFLRFITSFLLFLVHFLLTNLRLPFTFVSFQPNSWVCLPFPVVFSKHLRISPQSQYVDWTAPFVLAHFSCNFKAPFPFRFQTTHQYRYLPTHFRNKNANFTNLPLPLTFSYSILINAHLFSCDLKPIKPRTCFQLLHFRQESALWRANSVCQVS